VQALEQLEHLDSDLAASLRGELAPILLLVVRESQSKSLLDDARLAFIFAFHNKLWEMIEPLLSNQLEDFQLIFIVVSMFKCFHNHILPGRNETARVNSALAATTELSHSGYL